VTIDSFISLHLGEPLPGVFTWIQPDANTGECGYFYGINSVTLTLKRANIGYFTGTWYITVSLHHSVQNSHPVWGVFE